MTKLRALISTSHFNSFQVWIPNHVCRHCRSTQARFHSKTETKMKRRQGHKLSVAPSCTFQFVKERLFMTSIQRKSKEGTSQESLKANVLRIVQSPFLHTLSFIFCILLSRIATAIFGRRPQMRSQLNQALILLDNFVIYLFIPMTSRRGLPYDWSTFAGVELSR